MSVYFCVRREASQTLCNASLFRGGTRGREAEEGEGGEGPEGGGGGAGEGEGGVGSLAPPYKQGGIADRLRGILTDA